MFNVLLAGTRHYHARKRFCGRRVDWRLRRQYLTIQMLHLSRTHSSRRPERLEIDCAFTMVTVSMQTARRLSDIFYHSNLEFLRNRFTRSSSRRHQLQYSEWSVARQRPLIWQQVSNMCGGGAKWLPQFCHNYHMGLLSRHIKSLQFLLHCC